MNKITFPLNQGMKGSAVADLQDALQLCLDNRAILANDPGERNDLSAGLKSERERQTYDDITSKLVDIFQRERNLQSRGAVDEPTATALNALLAQWGLFDQAAPRSFVVSGQARREDGLPPPDLRVSASHQTDACPVRLGEDTTDAEGRYTIRYELLVGKLGDLKETDDRQEVTYLANKTGWDARAIAFAILADQFSARTAYGAMTLYALA